MRTELDMGFFLLTLYVGRRGEGGGGGGEDCTIWVTHNLPSSGAIGRAWARRLRVPNMKHWRQPSRLHTDLLAWRLTCVEVWSRLVSRPWL